MNDNNSENPESDTGKPDDLYGEVVFRVTRRALIEEGALLDISITAREAGIIFPVAITAGLWAAYGDAESLEASVGFLWDLCWMLRYRNAVKASLAEDAADFRSYVIGDSGREVRFDVERGSLEISGQPGYYFWRYNGDDPAVQQRVLSSVRTRIRLAKNTARQSQGAGFNENS